MTTNWIQILDEFDCPCDVPDCACRAQTMAAEIQRLRVVLDAARECVGFHDDGAATFQPEEYAQGLVDAIHAYDNFDAARTIIRQNGGTKEKTE